MTIASGPPERSPLPRVKPHPLPVRSAAATTIALLMEGHWGMGRTVTSHAVTHKVGVMGGGRPGGGTDEERKDLLGGSLGERMEGNLGRLLGHAQELLTEHRDDVLRLAHALETYKTLDGEDVLAVLEGRSGPVVDGRPYHDPDFGSALESYHDTVVSAHKGHDKITVPLPQTDGHQPAAAAVAVNSSETS